MATLKGFDLQASLNTLAGTKDRDAQDAANAWADASGFDLVGALNKKAGTTDFDLNGVCTKLLHATAAYTDLPTGFDAQAALTLLAQTNVPSTILAYAVQGGSSDFSTTKTLNATDVRLVIVTGCQTGANYEDTTVFSDSHSGLYAQLAWSNTESGVIIGHNTGIPYDGASITYTFGGSVPTDPSGGAVLLKGFSTLDVHAQADEDQPGSITPNTDGEFIVCVGGSATATSGTVSINEGFSILKGVSAATGSKTLYIAYLIQKTAGAVNPTWSGIPNCQSAIAAFKAT